MAPQADDDLKLVAARERAGRAKANDVITCFADWYDRLRKTYGASEPEPALAHSALTVCTRMQKDAVKRTGPQP